MINGEGRRWLCKPHESNLTDLNQGRTPKWLAWITSGLEMNEASRGTTVENECKEERVSDY
jgi:hypothetical protein